MILKEIDLLPPKLLAMPSAKLVGEWYRQSFEDLLAFEHVEPTPEQVSRFK